MYVWYVYLFTARADRERIGFECSLSTPAAAAAAAGSLIAIAQAIVCCYCCCAEALQERAGCTMFDAEDESDAKAWYHG